MSRRLFSLLAITAAIVATMGLLGSNTTPARASGIGGNIDYHFSAPASLVATNVIGVGVPYDVTVTLTSPTVDAFSGYNIGMLYNPLQNAVLGVTDVSVASGFWASDACSPPNNTVPAPPPAPAGTLLSLISCSSNSGFAAPAGAIGDFAVFHMVNTCAGLGTFTPPSTVGCDTTQPGIGFVHMVAPLEAGTNAGSNSTYTIDDATSSIQTDTYSCSAAPSASLGCVTTAASPYQTLVELSVLPASVVTITKTAATGAIIEGDANSFTITVTNPSTGTSTPMVTVHDIIPAQFTVGALPAGCVVTTGGTGPNDITCGPVSLATGGGTQSWIIPVTSNTGSGGSSPQNCASFTSSTGGTGSACATVQINGKNTGFHKSPAFSNLWLALNCDPNVPGPGLTVSQCAGQEVNSGNFDEILSNAADPFGLGGISWDIHYDPTQFLAFTLCNSNANGVEDTQFSGGPVETPAMEAVEGGDGSPSNACDPSNGFIDIGPLADLMQDFGRTANCAITQNLNGLVHVACVSTGPLGTGPVFAGDQIVAHVHKVPQPFLVEAIRQNKENGDVSVIKDDQVTVTNTAGQPLNGGCANDVDFLTPSGSPFEDAAFTIPDQFENCAEGQGDLLGGVGPGGVLSSPVSTNVETIRRLEGDLNKDCSVDLQDMQIEASKFGQSTGSLLFNVFFDVNTPLQHGDGEIDINDVQFVFGRFGSECTAPIPAQDPVQNPDP